MELSFKFGPSFSYTTAAYFDGVWKSAAGNMPSSEFLVPDHRARELAVLCVQTLDNEIVKTEKM